MNLKSIQLIERAGKDFSLRVRRACAVAGHEGIMGNGLYLRRVKDQVQPRKLRRQAKGPGSA